MTGSSVTDQPGQPPFARTEICFFGGPLDGEVLLQPICVSDVKEADCVLWQTDGGQHGRCFYTLSDFGRRMIADVACDQLPMMAAVGMLPSNHCYEVTARWVRKDCICLYLKYRGVDD